MKYSTVFDIMGAHGIQGDVWVNNTANMVYIADTKRGFTTEFKVSDTSNKGVVKSKAISKWSPNSDFTQLGCVTPYDNGNIAQGYCKARKTIRVKSHTEYRDA